MGAAKYFAKQVEDVAGEQAVGIWDFDECSGTSATDRSGFGNDGTLVGSPTWSSDTPSGTGCSLSFNGTSQYVTVPDTSLMRFDISQSFTVSVWASPASLTATYGGIAVKSRASGNYYGIYMNLGRWTFAKSNIISPNTTSAWHNVVITQDGPANTRVMYVDGVFAVRGVAIDGSGAGSFRIGSTDTSEYFQGSVDSVRVYAKSLSASEVGKLYAEGLRDDRFASSLAK